MKEAAVISPRYQKKSYSCHYILNLHVNIVSVLNAEPFYCYWHLMVALSHSCDRKAEIIFIVLKIILSYVCRIRDSCPAFDSKKNTRKIWSVATMVPNQILCKSKLRISILTNCSSQPLHLTPYGKLFGFSYLSKIQYYRNT